MDTFLREDVGRTLGRSYRDYNKKYACDCVHPHPVKPDILSLRAERMTKEKLQYVSFTYDFDQGVL